MERMDIVKQIEASILEMERENLSTEDILERLGKPKDLAKAYLGDLLSKESGFSWKKFLIICAFYSSVGFSGLFIIPCLIVIAPTFMVCGIMSVIAGIVKIIDSLFHLGIPYMEYVDISLTGIVELNPFVELIGTLIIGGLLYLIGQSSWKLLIYYCQKVSQVKNHLAIFLNILIKRKKHN